MRARLAIQSSGIKVQLREIVLRDKAPQFLASSAKGTVPVIVAENKLIEESYEIMLWALSQSDPEGWLKMPDAGYDWISRNDGPFKRALDHIKYSVRFPKIDLVNERDSAVKFLCDLNVQLSYNLWMFGKNCSLSDMAILPFVRQFANVDKVWFDSQDWQHLHRWLSSFLISDRFSSVMIKYEKWVLGNPKEFFPNEK